MTSSPPDPERVAAVTSASLSDALADRFAHRFHILDLISPVPDRVLFGPAATVQFMPRREDLRDPAEHEFSPMLHAAVGEHAEGAVLVISSGGCPDAAVAGGKKLSRLSRLGMAGILTDARLRDFDEVDGLGIAAWCGGETTIADRREAMPFTAGAAVSLEAVTVIPGDWIYADAAGAVVIPAEARDGILDAAAERERADAAEVERIAKEYGGTTEAPGVVPRADDAEAPSSLESSSARPIPTRRRTR